jgi:hypothetical protein
MTWHSSTGLGALHKHKRYEELILRDTPVSEEIMELNKANHEICDLLREMAIFVQRACALLESALRNGHLRKTVYGTFVRRR